MIADSLPIGLQASVAAYVDDANIRPVLDKFIPEIVNHEEVQAIKKMKSKLHQLFDTRNAIVHKGQAAALSRARCEEFLEVAKKLVALRA